MSEFRTIVADPPWPVKLGSSWKSEGETWRTKARPQGFYPTMQLDEIKNLIIPSNKQAHLYLWAVNQHVDWGFEVARAWGFNEYVQMLTWKKPGMGCGQFQCNTEQVMLFRKGGRQQNAFGKTGGTGFEWPRGKHSVKPSEFYQLVTSVSPGPYLELFSRQHRQGWTCLGNAIDGNDIRSALEQLS